nr:PepSY-associated TM helix domain-containing protein [Acinetobacter sp. Marseille-Q1620]
MKVRTDILKLAKELHTWVGISAGILLFICFFAGGLTMFQHDLSQWATPPQQKMSAIHSSQYNELVEEVQQKYPDARKNLIVNFSSKEMHNAPVQWHISKESSERGFDTSQNTMLATLDSQGQLQVQQENVSKLGWLIEQLHETAGIPGLSGHHTLGVYVMGVVAFLYFLAIFSGLIILLPTLVKDYFAIRKGKNKKRFWLDTHNVIGITSLPFHIIICISVIVFAFHDFFYDALGQLANKGKPLFERPVPMQLADPQPKLDVEKILFRLKQSAPEYEIMSISFNQLDKPEMASARVALYSSEQMLRGDNFDYMFINPYQEQPYNINTLNTHATIADQVIKSMFSLHFGNFGGNITRWMYFILGIGGAFLFYSGNILWIESRLKRQKNPDLPVPSQRKDVHFVTNLTIGACLGTILAIFSSMLAGRWGYVVYPELNSINHLFMYSYYAVFLTSLMYTFVVGAARALPQLLLAIAIVLFTLPLTSLIAYLVPDVGLWYSTGHLLTIDLTAFVFALAFLRFYQQARIRAEVAEIGSIWSVKAHG